MAGLPSIPSLPSINLPKVVSFVKSPAAVLNVVSLIAKNLPKLNPKRPIYAILNAETQIPLALPDSWAEIVPRFMEYQVSDYPIEAGEFAAYNKVRRPCIVDVVLVKEGTDLERATWLEAIRQQASADPTALYNIITPQGIFPNLTMSRGVFQARPDRGSNMLYLELQFSEVPQIRTPSLLGSFAVQAESGPMAEIGRVYPTDTPSGVAALASAGAPAGSALSVAGGP